MVLVECLKGHMKNQALSLVESANGQAVLFMYSADGTPLKTAAIQTDKLGESVLRRKGRVLHELFLQRGII